MAAARRSADQGAGRSYGERSGNMLSSLLALLLNSAFLTLRLGNSGGSFPRPLSAEEERKYVALAAEGDEEARGILIEHNLRLVAHIIKKYFSATCDQDDLISIGTVGLIKGISSYRPDRGVRLATYASRCVENEILMYFRSQRKTAGDVSLSDALDSDGEGGLSLQDILYEEDDILERLALKEDSRRLRQYVITELDRREREIVTLRYGLGGGSALPQREVAAKLGISRSYVSRLEKKALDKLRNRMEGGRRD